MQLTTFETDTQTVKAGYTCPCGCTPSVTYQRGGELARSHCCCGNEFVVGPGAERTLEAREGFVLATEPRTTGWGEAIMAAWSVGPSVHPEPAGSHDDHAHGHGDHRGSKDAAIDPVCGMRVDCDGAIEKGLHRQHAGADYYFCAKGCYLDFGDDPKRYLDPSYIPSM